MKAGTYYVGDLCYVMHDKWEEVCNLSIVDGECLSGEFALSSGGTFAMYGTEYGDGTYEDLQGLDYSVDSGTLGCIETCFLDPTELEAAKELGQIIEMPNEFDTHEEDGIICFGSIKINTAQENEYDDDYSYDEDDDDEEF